jgi:hypothetical protein
MGEYEILYKMFGALQSLERSLQISKKTISINNSLPERIIKNVAEQERIIRHMQQISSTVQTEFSNKDGVELNRLVRIFYSLHYMVSPEISSTLEELNGNTFETKSLNSEQTKTLTLQ